jgi:hypothetical protein
MLHSPMRVSDAPVVLPRLPTHNAQETRNGLRRARESSYWHQSAGTQATMVLRIHMPANVRDVGSGR